MPRKIKTTEISNAEMVTWLPYVVVKSVQFKIHKICPVYSRLHGLVRENVQRNTMDKQVDARIGRSIGRIDGWTDR